MSHPLDVEIHPRVIDHCDGCNAQAPCVRLDTAKAYIDLCDDCLTKSLRVLRAEKEIPCPPTQQQ